MKKLLDPSGKPIQKTRVAQFVFYVSDDGIDNWSPLKPDEVPEELKDPDLIGYMAAGEILESPESKFYRVQKMKRWIH